MPARAPGPDVGAAFAELAKGLAEDGDPGPYLTAVCRHCVRLAGADSAAIVYATGTDGAMAEIVASDERARELAEASVTQASVAAASAAGEEASPWRDCADAGQLISVADLRTRDQRWPRFSDMAAAADFTAATFIPVGQPVARAALALMGSAEPDVEQILVALSLADAAAAGLTIAAVLRQQQTAIAQLQSALSSRIVIEQAKGMLAERWQIPPDRAFDALRRHARASQRGLADLAAAVVAGTAQPARPDPGPSDSVSHPCQA
jgi:ANTAR domain